MNYPNQLYLLIHANIQERAVKNIIRAFQHAKLPPDILVSDTDVALRWVSNPCPPGYVSVNDVVIEYIYVTFFRLLYCINKPFTVFRTGNLSSQLILGTYIPHEFPVEELNDEIHFLKENKLDLLIKKEACEFSFYPLFQKYCRICSLIIDDILSARCCVHDVQNLLAVHYQASYALLQTVLLSQEQKTGKWDCQFFEMREKIKKIKDVDLQSWLSVVRSSI